MFMLRAMTAAANCKSHPSLNVSSSEKSDGFPSEYRVNLKHLIKFKIKWQNIFDFQTLFLGSL